jgi:hypothetical protein
MADLRTTLTDQMKTAMKAGEQAKVETIRLIIAKMKEADINARAGGKDNATDTELMSMMQGMIKQRGESAKIYRDNNRPELAAKEEAEIAVIETFLPKQLSDEEAGAVIVAIIAETGAAGMKDMGKVMAEAKEKLAGQFDMSKASNLVKQKLVG